MANSHERPGSQGEHALQEKYDSQKRADYFYQRQMLDHLNPAMQDFIRRQEMVFVSTADAHGNCDCSFRAGLPGFVRVLDRTTLLHPEYRGNGVLASLGNIAENPHIGLIFIDFFEATIGLHVNGKARIVDNAELLQRLDLPSEVRQDMAVEGGRRAERWVLVEVEEAYIHCSKHIPLLGKRDKKIVWGTDDARLKGGDFFGVGACNDRMAELATLPAPARRQERIEEQGIGLAGWRDGTWAEVSTA